MALDMLSDGDAGPVDGLAGPATEDPKAETSASDLALVKDKIRTIKADKAFHEKAFKRMKRDMFVAKHGRTKEYPEGSYVANIAGRHVKQKTAGLYAKNPKCVARRRETLDFEIWDESPDSLKLAAETAQQGAIYQQQMAAAAQAAPMVNRQTGQVEQAPLPPPPVGLDEANAILADFKQGNDRRQLVKKTGRTLEVLYAHAMHGQQPIDFKMGMKKCVRRACTTAVGYVELGFQREMGPRPGLAEQLSDARVRLDHLRRLAEDAADGEIGEDDAEMAELERSTAELEAEPEIVLREGLIVDFPLSTKVIPDRMCRSLVGFIGARHLTIEYLFTVDEVKEQFGIDVGKDYKGYTPEGGMSDGPDEPDLFMDDEAEQPISRDKGKGLVCVWKLYDKPSGMVYWLADGHPTFLRDPAAPDVFVESFWPVYALTFNDVENEDELFPPSDVSLLLPMQMEYNRSRQGMREHRKAARPRWVYANGALDDPAIKTMQTLEPFEMAGVNLPQGSKIAEIMQAVPVPGVDPNLYETGPLFQDVQFVVGTQESSFGGLSKATATESAIAANSSASADGSSVDDLDAFLTTVSRAAGQILLREMSEEQAKAIAGAGAVWPHMSLSEISDELYLEIEAGSTGKPNGAIKVNNAKILGPLLLQTGAVRPFWLAKYLASALDDNIDLTDALADGIPAIVAANRAQQGAAPPGGPPQPGAPPADPTAGTGGPPAPEGSGPAFGSNQTPGGGA